MYQSFLYHLTYRKHIWQTNVIEREREREGEREKKTYTPSFTLQTFDKNVMGEKTNKQNQKTKKQI